MSDRDQDFCFKDGTLFIAPVDTGAPLDESAAGVPVTIDESGVTEWKRASGEDQDDE